MTRLQPVLGQHARPAAPTSSASASKPAARIAHEQAVLLEGGQLGGVEVGPVGQFGAGQPHLAAGRGSTPPAGSRCALGAGAGRRWPRAQRAVRPGPRPPTVRGSRAAADTGRAARSARTAAGRRPPTCTCGIPTACGRAPPGPRPRGSAAWRSSCRENRHAGGRAPRRCSSSRPRAGRRSPAPPGSRCGSPRRRHAAPASSSGRGPAMNTSRNLPICTSSPLLSVADSTRSRLT